MAHGYRRHWPVLALLGAALLAAGPSWAVESGAQARAMSWVEAAVLGVLEGLTEYLPVSSTGHLLVAQRALGIGTQDATAKQAADAFAICVQAGAILAVFLLYRARLGRVGQGLLGRDPDGRRLLGALLAGFLPAAAAGLLLGDRIKAHLFGPWPVVLAWAVGGGAILAVAWTRRDATPRGGAGRALEALTWRAGLLIGCAQCLALWPGVSRSLVTIVGGVLVGLSLPAAVEFSFLLGLLTLGAATVHDVVVHGVLLADTYTPLSLAVGFIAALLSALLAVRWMVAWLRHHGLEVFGYYRLAIAAVVAVLLTQGWL